MNYMMITVIYCGFLLRGHINVLYSRKDVKVKFNGQQLA